MIKTSNYRDTVHITYSIYIITSMWSMKQWYSIDISHHIEHIHCVHLESKGYILTLNLGYFEQTVKLLINNQETSLMVQFGSRIFTADVQTCSPLVEEEAGCQRPRLGADDHHGVLFKMMCDIGLCTCLEKPSPQLWACGCKLLPERQNRGCLKGFSNLFWELE